MTHDSKIRLITLVVALATLAAASLTARATTCDTGCNFGTYSECYSAGQAGCYPDYCQVSKCADVNNRCGHFNYFHNCVGDCYMCIFPACDTTASCCGY